MKKLFALLGLVLLAIASTCCAAHTPPRTDPVEVRVYRTFSITLHADVDFSEPGRKEIDAAADAWRMFTGGRVDIRVAYDLDFDSVENLRAHHDANDSVLIPITSDLDMVEVIDARLSKGAAKPVAVTAPGDNGSFTVLLIVDRIERAHFRNTVIHEFGHVAGMPDLPVLGAIMSGVGIRGTEALPGFMPEDRGLCAAYRYCD